MCSGVILNWNWSWIGCNNLKHISFSQYEQFKSLFVHVLELDNVEDSESILIIVLILGLLSLTQS